MEAQHKYKSTVQVNRRNALEHKTAQHLFLSQFVLEAEICCEIKMLQYSFNSSSDMSVIVGQMFPDSEIAKWFLCGATKTAYLVHSGLRPYF